MGAAPDDAVRRAGRIALGAAVAFVVYGTTIPWRFDLDPGAVARRWAAVDWAVVHLEGGRPRGLPDVVANCLFFMPLGAAWTFARGHRRALPAALGALTVGALLSTFVEALQLLTADRTTQLGDVVFNAGGGAVAAGATARMRSRLPAALTTGPGRWLRASPAHAALALAVTAVVLRGLAPFDVTLDVGAVKASLKAALAAPLGLAGPSEVLLVATPYAFVGFLAVGVVPGSAARALVASAALAAAIEGAQVFIGARTPGIGDVLAATAGAALGIAARRRVAFDAGVAGAGARAMARPAVLALSLMAAVEALSPFAFAEAHEIHGRLTARTLVPFAAYYAHLHHHVGGDLLDQALPFAFLGYVLAACRRGASPGGEAAVTRRVVCFAGVLALALETTQVFVAARVPDSGDVVVGALGAWLGVAVQARVACLTVRPAAQTATRPA